MSLQEMLLVFQRKGKPLRSELRGKSMLPLFLFTNNSFQYLRQSAALTNMNLLMNNLAEVKITYSSKIPACDRIKVRCSQDADKALRLIWPSFEHREFFYIMLLNRSNQILGFSQISMGGISGTVTDIRIIFQTAIKANSCGIILDSGNWPKGHNMLWINILPTC